MYWRSVEITWESKRRVPPLALHLPNVSGSARSKSSSVQSAQVVVRHETRLSPLPPPPPPPPPRPPPPSQTPSRVNVVFPPTDVRVPALPAPAFDPKTAIVVTRRAVVALSSRDRPLLPRRVLPDRRRLTTTSSSSSARSSVARVPAVPAARHTTTTTLSYVDVDPEGRGGRGRVGRHAACRCRRRTRSSVRRHPRRSMRSTTSAAAGQQRAMPAGAGGGGARRRRRNGTTT
jgi:hypothetical protein